MMNTSVVHHMLLYGCIGPYSSDNIWYVRYTGLLTTVLRHVGTVKEWANCVIKTVSHIYCLDGAAMPVAFNYHKVYYLFTWYLLLN